MSHERWSEVDRYIGDVLVGHDPALEQALADSVAAGLPPINVTPNQGKLLHLLVRIIGARRVLEIGTLGGYSTIWMARALPAGGRLVTLEAEPRHAGVARGNIERAGLSAEVDLRVGPALEALSHLASAGEGPFDLFFIDADKQHNPEYFGWCVNLSRPGSVIIVDNVVRDGSVVDGSSDDPAIRATRRLNELMASEPRVIATEIQTVGSKGYDGFAIALVTEP